MRRWRGSPTRRRDSSAHLRDNNGDSVLRPKAPAVPCAEVVARLEQAGQVGESDQRRRFNLYGFSSGRVGAPWEADGQGLRVHDSDEEAGGYKPIGEQNLYRLSALCFKWRDDSKGSAAPRHAFFTVGGSRTGAPSGDAQRVGQSSRPSEP